MSLIKLNFAKRYIVCHPTPGGYISRKKTLRALDLKDARLDFKSMDNNNNSNNNNNSKTN